MIYIERDEQGNITAIRRDEETAEGAEEKEVLTSDALMEFLANENLPLPLYKTVLEHMDTEFIRVLDDLVDVLVQKNVILLTDLPEGARKKIYDRKAVRLKIQHPQVIVDDVI